MKGLCLFLGYLVWYCVWLLKKPWSKNLTEEACHVVILADCEEIAATLPGHLLGLVLTGPRTERNYLNHPLIELTRGAQNAGPPSCICGLWQSPGGGVCVEIAQCSMVTTPKRALAYAMQVGKIIAADSMPGKFIETQPPPNFLVLGNVLKHLSNKIHQILRRCVTLRDNFATLRDNFATTLRQLATTLRHICDILRHFAKILRHFETILRQFCNTLRCLRPCMCNKLGDRKPNFRQKCVNAILATSLRHFVRRNPSGKNPLQRSREKTNKNPQNPS